MWKGHKAFFRYFNSFFCFGELNWKEYDILFIFMDQTQLEKSLLGTSNSEVAKWCNYVNFSIRNMPRLMMSTDVRYKTQQYFTWVLTDIVYRPTCVPVVNCLSFHVRFCAVVSVQADRLKAVRLYQTQLYWSSDSNTVCQYNGSRSLVMCM